MRVGIILTYGQHLHDRIISPSGETWVHKTSLTPPIFIEVHITSPESRKSCICVLRVSVLPLSTISLVLCGNVPTMWCLFGFQFIFYKTFSSCALSRINWQSYNSGNKLMLRIKVITKLPNSELSYKGKVKTHNYINRQNQSTTGKL